MLLSTSLGPSFALLGLGSTSMVLQDWSPAHLALTLHRPRDASPVPPPQPQDTIVVLPTPSLMTRQSKSMRPTDVGREASWSCVTCSTSKNLVAFLDFTMLVGFVKLCEICDFVVIYFLILVNTHFPKQCGIHS